MKILVTGAAGFIGSSLIHELAKLKQYDIIGIDNFNDYYDVNLKKDRIKQLIPDYQNVVRTMDIADKAAVFKLFETERPELVINLAAQAGVRYSLENPQAYIDSNIVGFFNILEACRQFPVKHLVYASSSSVYGGNTKVPFSTNDNVDHPVSLYAATKKSDELLAHSYSNLYGIPTTGLRFFTVYGPWGRPDMAYFSFTKNISENKSIKIFNHGEMMRDFTFIGDIVTGIIKVLDQIPQSDPDWAQHGQASSSWAPYKIYNIGNNAPVKLMTFISILEKYIGRTASKEYLPMQPGDVKATFADISDLAAKVNFKPQTSLDSGLKQFVDWYRAYYG